MWLLVFNQIFPGHFFSYNYLYSKAYTETPWDPYMGSLSIQETRDCIEKPGELWELSRDCRNSLGSEVLVSTIVYVSLHLYRVGNWGALSRWRDLPSRSQQHVVRHITRTHIHPKEASRINRILLTQPGLPTRNSSGSVGQCPGHLKYMLSFYQLAKTTQHTQPTQRPLLHKSTFSRQGKLFCLIHINKQKVKQNENISQMKGQEYSPEKNLNRA